MIKIITSDPKWRSMFRDLLRLVMTVLMSFPLVFLLMILGMQMSAAKWISLLVANFILLSFFLLMYFYVLLMRYRFFKKNGRYP
jgi:hypothetical protein